MIVKNEGQQLVVEFRIETDRCVGCKECIRNCQEDVWYWDEESQHAYPKYPDECVGCYLCELYCKGNCFEIAALEVLRHNALYEKPLFGEED